MIIKTFKTVALKRSFLTVLKFDILVSIWSSNFEHFLFRFNSRISGRLNVLNIFLHFVVCLLCISCVGVFHNVFDILVCVTFFHQIWHNSCSLKMTLYCYLFISSVLGIFRLCEFNKFRREYFFICSMHLEFVFKRRHAHGGGEGFKDYVKTILLSTKICDNSTKAFVIKGVTMGGGSKIVLICVMSFMDDPLPIFYTGRPEQNQHLIWLCKQTFKKDECPTQIELFYCLLIEIKQMGCFKYWRVRPGSGWVIKSNWHAFELSGIKICEKSCKQKRLGLKWFDFYAKNIPTAWFHFSIFKIYTILK